MSTSDINLGVEMGRQIARRADYQRKTTRDQEIAEMLDGLTDEDLADLKDDVLRPLSEDAQAFMGKHDPRKCAMLRTMIYERMKGTSAA